MAAFVGLAEKGPFNQPTLVSNWTQFTKTFGGVVDGACLAQSVFAYFQNGGGDPGSNARCAARAEYDSRMVNNAVLVFTPRSTTHRS